MTGPATELAIVIPAYKPEFFEQTLQSIAAQTDKRFRLYVGDDAGPAELQSMVRRFEERLDITYHRFDTNLGEASLVQQWQRCVELSSEPWVWLFADDDLADHDCVASFHRTLQETDGRYDVYRFSTVRIDESDQVILVNPPHPHTETSLAFLHHILTGQRRSYAPEHIFRRAVYDAREGLVDFPLAWCSDHASWAEFGRETCIRTVEGPVIRWRESVGNLTSLVDEKTAQRKIEATMQFCSWFRIFAAEEIKRQPPPVIPVSIVEHALSSWALGHWRRTGQTCSRDFLQSRSHEFARLAGLSEADLWLALETRAWKTQAVEKPHLAAFPRILTQKHPRIASWLDRALRAAARLAGNQKRP